MEKNGVNTIDAMSICKTKGEWQPTNSTLLQKQNINNGIYDHNSCKKAIKSPFWLNITRKVFNCRDLKAVN